MTEHISEFGPDGMIASRRFRAAMSIFDFLATCSVEIQGSTNLTTLPGDRRVVIATTHLSDIDVPLVASLISKQRDTVVSYTSKIDNPFKFPIAWLGLRLAGRMNFMPIDNGRPNAGSINLRQLDNISGAVRDGKAAIVAAHTPTTSKEFSRAGIAVPYIVETAGALVLPVAARVKGSERAGMGGHAIRTAFERPSAQIFVGEPFELSEHPNVDGLSALLSQRTGKSAWGAEERTAFRDIAACFRAQGEMVVDRLKEMLQD